MVAAHSATVGFPNKLRSEISCLNVSRIREITCVASNECPPNSKKLSCAPTTSTFNRSAQMPATICSTGVSGATYPPVNLSRFTSGCGSALTSTLPLGVKGHSSSIITTVGTMYSGKRSCKYSRSSAPPACRSTRPFKMMYPTNCWLPTWSSFTSTMHSLTNGCALKTTSISLNSTRKPRNFTCASTRPRYASSPPSNHRTRSPVRYKRAPGSALYGCGTNLSAVSVGRFR